MSRLKQIAKPQTHKIGLYIRVSTEEQLKPEGSIKSQEQRLRQHIEFKNQDGAFGEVTNVFIDRARSGKDTNRPELQRLLTAIRNREITLVMVAELSRLSRSIKDFADIWDMMRAHGCEFQSLREQFDTTTAAGEMVIYTIANISQFERKQCSERISANFQARAERGLFNGGAVPFGYELDPDKKGYLKTNEEDAVIIREAFHTFLREGCLSKAGKSLNERGYRLKKKRQGGGDKARLGYFTIDNLHGILTNAAYIGLRVFKVKGEAQTSKACWDAVIDEFTFKRVEATLKKNRFRLKSASAKRYPYLLSGLVFCSSCNDRLPGKSAHGNGGKIPYYEHGWATKRQAYLNKRVFNCAPHRVQAKILEPAVWEAVLNLLSDQNIAALLIKDANQIHENQSHVKATDKLRSKIQGITEQIDALAEHLAQIPKGVSPTPIFHQMQRLEETRLKTKDELNTIAQDGASIDLPASLRDYQAYLKYVKEFLSQAATPELKAKIVQKLIHKVEVLPDAFRLYYFVGENVLIENNTGSGLKSPGPFFVPKNATGDEPCGSSRVSSNEGG